MASAIKNNVRCYLFRPVLFSATESEGIATPFPPPGLGLGPVGAADEAERGLRRVLCCSGLAAGPDVVPVRSTEAFFGAST